MLAREQHGMHVNPVAGPGGLWKTTSPVPKFNQYICFSDLVVVVVLLLLFSLYNQPV